MPSLETAAKTAVPVRVLVVSPHPGDEAVGCGGAIASHVAIGAEVHVLFLTSGEQGGDGPARPDADGVHEREARAAAAILRVDIDFWREPDGRLVVNGYAVRRLRNLLLEMAPTVIYGPHLREMHPDHKAAARLLRRTVNGLRGARRPRLLTYEVWTPLASFDTVVDITPFVDVKRRAIRAYASQRDAVKLDEAALGLNRYRGEMHSTTDATYAEVFATDK